MSGKNSAKENCNSIVIVDYGMGNLGSIVNMFKKIGAEACLSADPAVIRAAERLILPGVGAFDSGMANLHERGLVALLTEKVVVEKTPILGLCLGMQLFSRGSEEGSRPGLGWIAADTVRFKFEHNPDKLKIPQMGWNYIEQCQDSPLFANMPPLARFYFVHSYHLQCDSYENVLATTDYGYDFPSMVVRDNIWGAQFHPEKSHKFGMLLLRNFAEYGA